MVLPEPKILWEHFSAISCIPHCSGNEEKIRAYIIELAANNEATSICDEAGNLVVRVASTNGKESTPVILQCHLDMVCEKQADFAFNFMMQGIPWTTDGDTVFSEQTTLGADNGIGIAACCALIGNRDIPHGNLELLFTIEEETGLVGAGKIPENLLQGKTLINLDSEDEKSIIIGCAGGEDVSLNLALTFSILPENFIPVKVECSGARGGHSGINIHEGRANPIQLLANALNQVYQKIPFLLCDIGGGDKFNAIPRESFAVVSVPKGEEGRFYNELRQMGEEIIDSFYAVEPNLAVSIFPLKSAEWSKTTDAISTRKIIDLLCSIPHGVARMNSQIPKLVETSSNLASVQLQDERCVIKTSHRSSNKLGLEFAAARVVAIGTLAGADAKKTGGYPGWEPDPENPLLQKVTSVYRDIFGVDAELMSIHAGLECGLIAKKYPDMEMVSIGPNIYSPHAPGEKTSISSVNRFWQFLCQILKEI